MNERINQLAGQAKFMAEEDINRQISYNTELKAFAEKFAQLIVRECIQVCIADIADPRDTIEQKCAKKIKEHFGGEE
jgi:hypothetical protein